MKKIAVPVILSALLLSLSFSFSSCSGGGSGGAKTTAASASTTAASAENTVLRDSVPAMDFGGKEFRILNHDSTSWNTVLYVEEQNGDVLNDAIYARNAKVEERFNIVMKQTKASGADAAASTARSSILAGEDAYDLIMLIDRTALTFTQENLLLSMYDLPYVDIDKPWWSQTINAATSIADKLYFSYGDFNLTAYDYTGALVFNKVLFENFKLDDPYALVTDGKWTIDKMRTMMVAATGDLNGDNVMDSSDRYGYTTLAKHVLPEFWIGAGVTTISKDKDDIPYISMDEKFIGICDKIFDIMYGDGVWNETVTFNSGNVLFGRATFGGLSGLRDVEFDFGIVPYPKWDEKQDGYHSRSGGGAFTVVPATAAGHAEMISAVMEALACESRNTVIPAYYQTVLKDKITRDAQSSDMLDIIFNNRVYDLGDTFWCNQIRDGFIQALFKSNSRTMSSAIAENTAAVNAEINKAVAAFQALK